MNSYTLGRVWLMALGCLNLAGRKLFRLQRIDLLKLNLECILLTSDLCSLFVASRPRSRKIRPLNIVFPPSGNNRPEEKYFPLFPSISCNKILYCSLLATWMLNSWNIVHIAGVGWGRVGSGRVRLFVGNRGSGQVNVSPGRVEEKWSVDNSDPSIIIRTLDVTHSSRIDQFEEHFSGRWRNNNLYGRAVLKIEMKIWHDAGEILGRWNSCGGFLWILINLFVGENESEWRGINSRLVVAESLSLFGFLWTLCLFWGLICFIFL